MSLSIIARQVTRDLFVVAKLFVNIIIALFDICVFFHSFSVFFPVVMLCPHNTKLEGGHINNIFQALCARHCALTSNLRRRLW